MKKKILSITLSLALMFSSLLASSNIGKSLAVGEDDWNYISEDDSNEIPVFPHVDFGPFVRGIGTHDEPYIISTAAQLAALSVLSNNVDELDNPELGEFYYLCDRYENLRAGEDFNGKYLVVENDIDLSEYRWTPIGINHSFKGNINFQGHTVDGIRIMVRDRDDQNTKFLGLFAKSEGSISNLTIGGRGSFHCVTNDACFGSVVALNKGNVSDCRNNFNAEVNGESSAIAGGIVGRNTGEGIIFRCINTGRISSGLYGSSPIICHNYNQNSEGNKLKRSPNFTFEIANGSIAISGGIVGKLENGNVGYCNNIGDVALDDTKIGYLGGIVGFQSSNLAPIINCISSSNLDFLLSVETLYCGEIVGAGYSDSIHTCYYLSRPQEQELFTFSGSVRGNGSFPGVDIGNSTGCVNQARLDQIRQQLNIPA